MRRHVVLILELPPARNDGVPSERALRAETLAAAIEKAGHRLTLASPAMPDAGGDAPAPPAAGGAPARPVVVPAGELSAFVRGAAPDVVISLGWEALSFVEGKEWPVVVDLFDTDPFEETWRENVAPLGAELAARLGVLARADLVLAGSERQRAWAQAWMALAGRDPRAAPVEVVPPLAIFPAGERRPPRAVQLVVAGVWRPWEDPPRLLPALAQAAAEHKRVGLTAVLAPGGARGALSPREREAWLDVESRLFSHECVRRGVFATREEWRRFLFSEATAGIDLFARESGRAMAPSHRAVEYLAHGVPVVAPPWSDLAPLLVEYGAGWPVDPDDPGSLRLLVHDVVENAAMARDAADRALALARERFGEAEAGPLLRFLDRPALTFAPGALPPLLRAQEALSAANARLTGEVRRLDDAVAEVQRAYQEKQEDWRFTRLEYVEKKREMMDMVEAERRRREAREREIDGARAQVEKERARLDDERRTFEESRAALLAEVARAAAPAPAPAIPAVATVTVSTSAAAAATPASADLSAALETERAARREAEQRAEALRRELDAVQRDISAELDRLEAEIAEKERVLAAAPPVGTAARHDRVEPAAGGPQPPAALPEGERLPLPSRAGLGAVGAPAVSGGGDAGRWREEANYWRGVARGMKSDPRIVRLKRWERAWTRLTRHRPALLGLVLANVWTHVVWSVKGWFTGSRGRGAEPPAPTSAASRPAPRVNFNEIRGHAAR
ncbi:MAG: hypothetical protein HY719_00840 [Planctomycetes bacterium]|nr:hypothetical protein [Planctomycetota bacterium]